MTRLRAKLKASALAHRDFRLLAFGDAVNQFGNAMFPIALVGLVAVRDGAAVLGLVLAVRGIVAAVLGLPAGALVGRFRRTRLLLLANLGELLVALGYAAGPHSTALLVSLAAASGIFGSVVEPAAGSLLPRIVPAERLQQANAFKGIANRAVGIAGPAAGGALLAFTDASTVFLVDAGTFLAGILALAAIREQSARPAEAEEGGDRFLRDLRDGLTEVRRHPWVVAVIAVATVQAPLTLAPGFTLFPIVAAAHYGSATYGVALSCMAAGEVIGGLLAAAWVPRRRGLVSLVGVLPYPLVLIALAGLMPAAVILVGYVVVGIGFMLFGVYWYSALQRDIPAERLGVVFGIDQVGSFGLQPLGYALSGVLAHLLGARRILLGAGVFGILSTLVPLAVPGVSTLADPPQPVDRVASLV